MCVNTFDRLNDHGLLTWEPAIGRQKQGLPLALRRPLHAESCVIAATV
jgi:MarR-like DNA-binding transcriptional regulator SgrR of sgrS sRNA